MQITHKRCLNIAIISLVLMSLAACNNDESTAKDGIKPASTAASQASSVAAANNKPLPVALHCAP
jgi:ABC-type uncharacterized transport system auxiliary subunit